MPSEQLAALRELVSDINAGRVQMLMIIGESNPVQTAPADLKFAEAMSKVQTRFHSALFVDETATLCHWHVPAAHYLEAWSDARTIDGTVSIVQPLIQPMFGGKSAHEIVQTLLERPERPGYDLVREFWMASALGRAASAAALAAPAAPAARVAPVAPAPSAPGAPVAPAVPPPPPPTPEQRAAGGFEKAWRKWLHDGFIAGTAFASVAIGIAPVTPGTAPVAPRTWRTWRRTECTVAPSAPVAPVAGIELNFRRDPTIYDGRFANNGWLQELPKPVTKLTWDNAGLISPATAERLDLDNGDIVEITHEGRRLRVPVWISPGHAADAITVHVGYGRTRAGRVGNATGFNAYVLRGSGAPWFGAAEISATGDDYQLVSTQDHWTVEGRNVVRSAPLEEFKATPGFARRWST